MRLPKTLYLSVVADSSDADGRTPLSYAAGSLATYYAFAICKLLVDKGASIHTIDRAARMPLSYICFWNYGKLQPFYMSLILGRGCQCELN